jgi:hypothetical protein
MNNTTSHETSSVRAEGDGASEFMRRDYLRRQSSGRKGSCDGSTVDRPASFASQVDLLPPRAIQPPSQQFSMNPQPGVRQTIFARNGNSFCEQIGQTSIGEILFTTGILSRR